MVKITVAYEDGVTDSFEYENCSVVLERNIKREYAFGSTDVYKLVPDAKPTLEITAWDDEKNQ